MVVLLKIITVMTSKITIIVTTTVETDLENGTYKGPSFPQLTLLNGFKQFSGHLS